MRAAIRAIMPYSTTLPFRRAWEYFIKGLSTHILHLQHLAHPVLKTHALQKLASPLRYVLLQVWGDRWMQSDEECFVTKWWDVKSHRKLNLLDACLLKQTYLSLCSLIPIRGNFDLTGIFFPGSSLGITAIAISLVFLSSQASGPLKIETYGHLAQFFGSSQVFSPIVLLFVYSLLIPALCTLWWGCAPEPFPNAWLSLGGDPAPQTEVNSALFVSPRAILRTLMIRIIVGLIGREAFTSISSKVMPMIDSSTIARSNWFHLETTQNEV